jgi:hypothetical protein
MTHHRRTVWTAIGMAMITRMLSAAVATADPSDTETFQGCLVSQQEGVLTLTTGTPGIAVQFDLSRMDPASVNLAANECYTVRAYPGSGPSVVVWFAESIEQGDERIETTGREITKETTSDSPAKQKKKNDD